jgi:hypothetical protein
MKITDPEILKKLREFCKVEVRRMNAEERAELDKRKATQSIKKQVRDEKKKKVPDSPAKKTAK